jgi:hypothetical protein
MQKFVVSSLVVVLSLLDQTASQNGPEQQVVLSTRDQNANGLDVGVVVVVQVNGVDGYTTYQLKLDLPNSQASCYTIFGDKAHPMAFPPAYQVPAPFGSNVGGTNTAFYPVKPETQFDSWLTAGETADTAGSVSAIGIDFSSWNEHESLFVDDGAVFWMSPDHAPHVHESVVAQLTLPNDLTDWEATLNAQGRSKSIGGTRVTTHDWDAYDIAFSYKHASSGTHRPTPMPPPPPPAAQQYADAAAAGNREFVRAQDGDELLATEVIAMEANSIGGHTTLRLVVKAAKHWVSNI